MPCKFLAFIFDWFNALSVKARKGHTICTKFIEFGRNKNKKSVRQNMVSVERCNKNILT